MVLELDGDSTHEAQLVNKERTKSRKKENKGASPMLAAAPVNNHTPCLDPGELMRVEASKPPDELHHEQECPAHAAAVHGSAHVSFGDGSKLTGSTGAGAST